MNKITNFHYLIILIFFGLVSCTNNSLDNLTNEEDVKTSTKEENEEEQEVSSPEPFQAQHNEPKAEVAKKQEVAEAQKEIVKKYGEQWDFCTCIVKGDSVNTAMMEDDIADEVFEQLMERSDHIDSKCKHLLVQPNSTPEERDAHNKKVKDCLRRSR